MELRYRVLLPGDAEVRDVRVELAEDATVGELSAALAEHCGLDPRTASTVVEVGTTGFGARADRPAAEAAPRTGATVRLAHDDTATRPPWWAPVVLRRLGPAGAQAETDESVRLAYGTTAIGAARLRVDSSVSVHTTGAVDRVEVDGEPVRGGGSLGHGSLLRVGDTTFELRVEGPLRPRGEQGPWRHHGRVPAVVAPHEPRAVELPTPPSTDRLPGFPLISAAVPLLLGGGVWLVTGSLAVAGFVLFGVAFVVASGIEIRREHRRDRRFREQQFLDDLASAVAVAEDLRADELARAERDLPSGAEVASWAQGHANRTWERWPAQPSPLRVRIGTEDAGAEDPVVVPVGGRSDLRARLVVEAERLRIVHRPAGVDLGVSGLAVCGTADGAAALARSVVVQLVGCLAPEHLSLLLDVAPERAAAWDWLAWLPHRVHEDPGSTAAGRSFLRIVDRSGGRGGPRGNEVLTGTLWLADDASQVPDGIGTVVVVGPDGAQVRRDDGPPTQLVPDGMTVEACEPAARALTSRRAPGLDAHLPDSVSLADLLVDAGLLGSPVQVLDTWNGSRASRRGLWAPVARAAGGVAHLDLRADGPHGLVAGTTGAGKSELLRTLVASLALHHPPDRLTFLLVDYKGGAAFGAVAELPHVVGLVTDLGPAEAARALASLRAEVRRRERVVASAGVTDMSEVPASDAEPSLVVVVDEFATLAAELPALLDGLLDVAQRGRSLGVHLVLATQRPTGVVTDAIRANLSLRLALRVADREDSRDVVDVEDAAHLPTDRPGRAVLRTGPGRHSTIQIATTSDALVAGGRVRCSELRVADDRRHGGRRVPEVGRSVLDSIVEVCRAAATADDVPPPRRPWLEPLPHRVRPTDLPQPSRPGALVIGVSDLPDEQRRGAAELDVTTGGGLLVLGAPRSGRSTALRTIAMAAVADDRVPTTVVALDAGRALGPLLGAAGPGGAVTDVVGVDDVELTLRLLRRLVAECRVATHDHHRSGRTVLLVDGVGALVDRHERVNRGEAGDLLAALVHEGPAAGVHVVAAAARPAEVPPPLLAAFDRRLVLRCASADDAALFGVVDPHGVAVELSSPTLPPGRGFLDGRSVQLAEPAPSTRPVRATTVRPLPRTVDVAELAAASGWRVPVGLRADDLRPAVLDLSRSSALVLGPPRSGRTNAVRLVARRLAEAGTATDTVEVDGHHPDGAATCMREVLDRARSSGGATAGGTVVVVDDLPELLGGPDGTEMDHLLQQLLLLPPEAGVRVVAAGEADAAARCYGDSLRRLRSGRTGMLLRPDPDLHPALLHTVLPLHDELAPAPGRGWIVTPDGVCGVQLAR